MRKYTLKDFYIMLKAEGLIAEMQAASGLQREVQQISYDSKNVGAGTLFVCKGAYFKKNYLEEALQAGAFCYVSEAPYDLDYDVPYIIVKDIRKAMSCIAAMYHENPEKQLKLIGVTGTKGKSTTVHLLKSILDEYLIRQNKTGCAVLSSIETNDGVICEEAKLTTPEPFELFQHLRNAVDTGKEYTVMEVSSQALKYGRTAGLEYDLALFLNIAEDHISPSEHPNFRDYMHSKMKIFDQTLRACINTDSDYSDKILDYARDRVDVVTFGMQGSPDIKGYLIESKEAGTKFRVVCNKFRHTFQMHLPGDFNVENALAAIAAAYAYDIPVDCIFEGVKNAYIKGRMESFVSEDEKLMVMVDYAHNGLSFLRLFQYITKKYPEAEIVSIFGCVGGKAYNRRKETGMIAGQYSDKIYLVPDNPGFENPDEISMEIAESIIPFGCEYEILDDREAALQKAIESMKKETIILLLGKGHEESQKCAGQSVACDSDLELARSYVERYNIKREVM